MNAARSVSSAKRPCSSLAGRNVVHCKLNLCKTSRNCSAMGKGLGTGGGVKGSPEDRF